MSWYLIAFILYLIPVAHGIRHFEIILDDAKDWMRESGEWFPSFAPIMAGAAVVFWPVTMLVDALDGDDANG